MRFLSVLELLLGIVVVGITLFDLFQSVVLPRPAVGRIRLSPWLIRLSWAIWRRFGRLQWENGRREAILGSYGPLALLTLLGAWVLSLVLGYGLVLHSLGSQLSPAPDFGTALYFSGASLLTFGYAGFEAIGVPARIVVLTEGANGLALVALVVSLLFSLYASFQQREVLVITTDASAGAPPSGVTLLENAAALGMGDLLADTFDAWKIWSAQVLDSHLAYPILGYFRSSHDNESWLSSLGAVLDAATLVMTTVEGAPHGHAKLMYGVGTHLVEDLSQVIGPEHDHSVGIERFEFDDARERLSAAGYELRDADLSWERFSKMRSLYAVDLNALARHWEIPPSLWIGDRTLLAAHVAAHARPAH
ncbi:MAG: two pore domain potassium channel family protein [Chloroflexi bacterium]|nr:MAG: two pore domain potassium channel family protein [Chloroflexota bacterium]TME15575.1 MAG: two pore domain potassium channel family protein [Chloroflexota bacterium]TME19470.1 MAG: two pore domain potassium channel family protein [Chloroflexota bacterium]